MQAFFGQVIEPVTDVLVQLEPYAQLVTVNTESIDALIFGGVSTADLPLPVDTLRYLLAMFACFPLAFVFGALPAGLPRHLFNSITGILLAQYVFGTQWVVVLVPSLVVFVFLHLGGVLRSWLPLTVFVYMIAFMVIAHTIRLYHDFMGWSLDVTGPLMLLTIKLSSIGFQYSDGTDKRAKVKEIAENGSGGLQRMYQDRLDRSIQAVPSLFEFLGFVFCPTTFFAGPAFDIREYLSATNRSSSDAAKLPSRIVYVIQQAVIGVLFLGLTGYGQANYPMLQGTAPNVNVNTLIVDPNNSFLQTIQYASICLFFTRVKYYFAWVLSESTAVLFGYGYNGKNWSGAANVDVLGFELASNISNGSRAWNKHTQSWLERYVYKRAPRSMSMYATYFVSAIWHGLYPGYYLFFLSVPLAQNLAKKITADVRPLTFNESNGVRTGKWWRPLYNISGIILTNLTMNYLASAFVVLSWGNGIAIWSAYKWAVHIICVLLYVPVHAMFKPIKTKRA